MSDSSSQINNSESNLFRRFCDTAGRYPDSCALAGEGGRGAAYTYAQVRAYAEGVAARLLDDQLIDKAGVGILATNCPEWPIAYLGIVAAGGTAVPIDANLKPDEIAHVIKHSQMTAVICGRQYETVVRQVAPELPVFILQELEHWKGKGVYVSPSGGNETAALIYTSGTTGQPKAVELTHRNLLANLDQISPALDLGEGDTFLSVLPLHHTFEATCGLLVPLNSGCRIVYARSMNSRDLIRDLGYNKVTLLLGVPLLFEKMCTTIQRKIKAAPWHSRAMFGLLYRLSGLGRKLGLRWGRWLFAGFRARAGMDSLRTIFSGAAPLPPRIAEFFCLIGFEFLEGYGMTEASPVISFNLPGQARFGSVGPPLPGVEVRIAQPSADGIGEILVRGDNVTPGYRGNPEQTAELLRDGWLHTGDLGRLHEGHLWITGRAKDLIVSAAGKNIYPEELEERLLESPLVLEAVVFGRRRDNRQGEDICAVLVPDLEQMSTDHGVDAANPDMAKVTLLLKEMVDSVNKRQASYKHIVDISVQIDELTKTSTKKVKRYLYK